MPVRSQPAEPLPGDGFAEQDRPAGNPLTESEIGSSSASAAVMLRVPMVSPGATVRSPGVVTTGPRLALATVIVKVALTSAALPSFAVMVAV